MKTALTIMAFAAIVLASSTALADPPDDYVTKFMQKPMVELKLGDATNLEVYYGHDELSTAYLQNDPGTTPFYRGTFMADDFADKVDQPVAHVTWWGSYMDAITPDNKQVQQFLISFESDVPATADHYSYPGEVLSSQIVTLDTSGGIPAAGAFTERPIHPGGPPLNERLYQYNAELAIPFPQEIDTVYWLKIVALVDQNDPAQEGIAWGWHNRDYTAMDPYASQPPAVVPGEHVQGTFVDSTGKDIPVWHFQDDAVTGDVHIGIDVDLATGEQKIVVDQNTLHETYYIPGIDMPYEVQNEFSKDLAFALYAQPVPEPSTFAMIGLAVACLLGVGRRGRKS